MQKQKTGNTNNTSINTVINASIIVMANKSFKERGIRNIQRSNGTYYVTLPKEFVSELKWRERQKVVVKKSGSKLIITDWE